MVWIGIAIVWELFTKQITIKQIGGLKEWINYIFSNGEMSIYYFMFEILGVYLTMPLISLLADSKNRKALWGAVILFFIFNGFIPNILGMFGINWNMSFSIKFDGYVFYAILGYLLSTEDNLNKKKKVFIYVGAILGLIYRYLTTFILSKKTGVVDKTSWGYFSWHCILLSSAVFILFKDLRIDEKLSNNVKIKNILAQVASCSFGIYLSHMFIIHYIQKFWNPYSWTYRTFGIFVVYLISLLFIYILKKIPILNKIVP